MMKKLLLLLQLICCLSVMSQPNQVNIVNFIVKNSLPANVESWMNTPGALVLTVQRGPQARDLKPFMVLQIRSGGSIICGNNASTAKQIDPFDVRTFTTSELTSYLAGCKELKEGTYSICVQFFSAERKELSREVCKEFTVDADKKEYSPPQNIAPADKKQFTEREINVPVTFRWTPVVPKPQAAVTYRIKVWQLMQGQNAATAMRTNQPIVTKDVDNITQAVVSGIYTGPCKPPYLCDFVWVVQALNREGNPVGNNYGTSEPFTLSVSAQSERKLENVFPEDKKTIRPDEAKAITFRWTPVVPKPQSVITYRIKVWQLMQGQTGAHAMRTNKPIVTKDVADITEATVSGIYTGPCRPPYLCDFIWAVEAITRDGSNATTSEPFTFKIAEGTSGGITNQIPEDKKSISPDEAKAITFRWTPVVPKPQSAISYRIKVWQLMQGQNPVQAMRTNKPIVTKDVADITEATVNEVYTGPCRPPYLCDFVWAVDVINRDGSSTGGSEPFTFKVNEGNTTGISNQFPEDKKVLKPDEAKTITFRWTPLVPKPQEPVTYRIKVWQLMQGQNPSQAMRTNKPIITKDVADITEATVSGIYTGPCRPPYLCDFVWNVQALNKAGNPIGNNNGTSEPTSFAVTQYIIQLDSIKVLCTNTPGVYSFSYTITNPNPGPATLNLFTVTSSVPAGASIGSFTPPINTVINSGNQLTITGTINAAPNLSNICIGAEIRDVGNTFWKASKDTCAKVDACRCDACDEKNFVFTAPKPSPINYTNNTLAYNQNITVTTTPAKTIKSITAELVYFEMVPENNLCIPCNKDAATYGHFTNGTNSLQWNGPQTSLNINITTPQLVPCCSALFRWCIRYKIEFTDCTSCSKLVCYEKKKEGCEKLPADNNPKDSK